MDYVELGGVHVTTALLTAWWAIPGYRNHSWKYSSFGSHIENVSERLWSVRFVIFLIYVSYFRKGSWWKKWREKGFREEADAQRTPIEIFES